MSPHDVHESICALASRVDALYAEVRSLDPSPAPVSAYCVDEAGGWVARAAIEGRFLPVNGATVQALSSAVRDLEGVRTIGRSFAAVR